MQVAGPAVEITIPEPERFAGPDSGAGQQTDESPVRDGSQRRAPRFQPTRPPHEQSNLLVGEDVRSASATDAMGEPERGHLGARIERRTIAGETANHAQAVGNSNGHRGPPRRPLQSDGDSQWPAGRRSICKTGEGDQSIPVGDQAVTEGATVRKVATRELLHRA
jgi:hypothetical protein